METDSQYSFMASLTDALQAESASARLPQENVVLFVGRSGNGTSTLVQLLAKSQHLYSKGEEGHYYILDKDGHIGNPSNTTISHTKDVRAVWHADFENDTCYFDCPGFGNANSPRMDLMCSIATKKALKNRKKVKIILVVSHQEVKSGGQRNAFLELVQHVKEFVKDIKRFENSIALFVTKVPNIVENNSGRRQLVPDENIKQSVAEFLENVRRVAQDPKIVTKEKKDLFRNATLLIDILMSPSKTRQTHKIGIMRCPDEAGFVNSNENIQMSVDSLNTLIKDNLKFTIIGEHDFGYTVSSSSKASLADDVQNIIDDFKSNLSSLYKEIQKYYDLFENSATNMDTLRKQFTKQNEIWQALLKDLSEKTRTSEVLAQLVEHVRKLLDSKPLEKYVEMSQNILEVPTEMAAPRNVTYTQTDNTQTYPQEIVDLDKIYYSDIDEANKVIKVLRQKLADENAKLIPSCSPKVQVVRKPPPECQVASNPQKRLLNLEQCLEHLNLLEEAVGVKFQHSTSKLQMVVKKLVEFVQNTNTWHAEIIPTIFYRLCHYELQSKKSTEDMRTFLQTLEDWGQKIDGKMVTDKQLNDVSMRTTGIPIKVNASAPKLRHLLTACRIAFSEHNEKTDNGCLHITGVCVALSSICLPLEKSIRRIEIFASVRVLIDCDWDLSGKGISLFIAAPFWEVVGETRSIILDGLFSEYSGYSCSGSFLGVGTEILNAQELQITTCAIKQQLEWNPGRDTKSKNNKIWNVFSRGETLQAPKNGFHAGCALFVGVQSAELPHMVVWNTVKITTQNFCNCNLNDYRQSLVRYKKWFDEDIQNLPVNERLEDFKRLKEFQSWFARIELRSLEPCSMQQLIFRYFEIAKEAKLDRQRDLNALLIYDILFYMGSSFEQMKEKDANVLCLIFIFAVFQHYSTCFENNYGRQNKTFIITLENYLYLLRNNMPIQGNDAETYNELVSNIQSPDKLLSLVRKILLFEGNLTNESHIKEYYNFLGILMKRKMHTRMFRSGPNTNKYFINKY